MTVIRSPISPVIFSPFRAPTALYKGGGGYRIVNAEAAAYIAAMDVEPTDRWKELYDVFIGELKTAGIWGELDICYLTAAHDQQAARLNLKSPGNFTCVNVGAGPTFEAGKGITPNGSTTAWSTQWSPATNGVNYTQNDASIWVYINTSPDAAGNIVDVGSNSGARVNIHAYGTGGFLRGYLNDATLSTFGGTVGDATGLSGISRASSGTKEGWKNGGTKGTVSVASTGLPSTIQYIGAGALSTFGSTKQVSFAAWGGALTSDQVADLNTAIVNFMEGVVWITGEYILLNGDSGTNSIFVEELELATGLPVYDIGVGGTDPVEQLAVFEALPPIQQKYGIWIDFDLGINPTAPATVIAAKQAQIAYLANPKRWLVIDPSPGEYPASDSYRTNPTTGFDVQVAAMASTFGERFIECLAELQALNDGSPEDLADVANDIVPRSLRSDTIHETQVASEKRAQLAAAFMTAQGWI